MARSPASIPGLLRWGVAADAVASGNAADLTIRDRVSGSTYRQITTTAQVTLITTTLFGGKQVLVFGGTAAGLIDETPLQVGPAFSVWVAGYRTGGGANSIFAAMDTVTGTRLLQLGRSSNPTDYLRHVTFATDSQPRIGNAVGLGVLANPKSLLGTASAARAASYVNGDGGTQATTPGGQTQSGALRLVIGRAEPATASYFLTGRIAAWAIFDHELTTEERALLDSYAQDEYGIAVSNYVPDTGVSRRAVTAVSIGSRAVGRVVLPRRAVTSLGIASTARASLIRRAFARTGLGIAATAYASEVDLAVARTLVAIGTRASAVAVQQRRAVSQFGIVPWARAHRVALARAVTALGITSRARGSVTLTRYARTTFGITATATAEAGDLYRNITLGEVDGPTGRRLEVDGPLPLTAPAVTVTVTGPTR